VTYSTDILLLLHTGIAGKNVIHNCKFLYIIQLYSV